MFAVASPVLDIRKEYNKCFYDKRTSIVLHRKSCSAHLQKGSHHRKDVMLTFNES